MEGDHAGNGSGNTGGARQRVGLRVHDLLPRREVHARPAQRSAPGERGEERRRSRLLYPRLARPSREAHKRRLEQRVERLNPASRLGECARLRLVRAAVHPPFATAVRHRVVREDGGV